MSEKKIDQNDDALSDEWAAALQEQADVEADWDAALQEQQVSASTKKDKKEKKDQYRAPSFENFDGQTAAKTTERETTDEVNLDVILDVPVTISMEIGRTQINIRNLLQLNQGSVVELDRLAGEPMDVLVNGTLIAHGEVVVVNDKFGIRLTDVISPAERVRKLG